MEAERESVGLAVSLTAGAAAANYSFTKFCALQDSMLHAACALISAFAIVWMLCHAINCRGLRQPGSHNGFSGIGLLRGRLLLGSLFAIAGACICTIDMTVSASFQHGPGPIKAFAMSCAGNIKDVIDSISFGDARCNAVMKAFLTGDRSGLDSHTREIFRQSGASHLLALSGMHIGILHVILSKALSMAGNSPFARKSRAILTVTGAGFFTIMTGASASLVRAFLFILLGETAKLCGRKADGATLLCSALMIQLALKPGIISSISFQLSYLAMAGIFIVYPRLKGLWPEESGGMKGSRKARIIAGPMKKIWELCALSISCQLFTGPLAWFKFGTFPQYFLLTNLMCIPLMTLTMAFSTATAAMEAAGICPGFMAAICERLIASMIFILETISSMQAPVKTM
ncbi:MAG: ComEC/Rec2 family competence protein [Bacteroidales bacterium]|nr:ComEC/Rec2 family competence protein [Bacteroidales bacterium]